MVYGLQLILCFSYIALAMTPFIDRFYCHENSINILWHWCWETLCL